MPTSVCLRTTSATDSSTRAASSASSMASPVERARSSALMLSGRTRLPTCVVRMRSVLVFMRVLLGGNAAQQRASLGSFPVQLR